MNNSLIYCFMGVLFAISSLLVNAQETPQEEKQILSPLVKIDRSISGRLITGEMSHKYSTDNPYFKFKDSMPFWGIGLTFSPAKLFSIDAYFQKSDKGFDSYFESNQNTEARFNREDWVSTAGYRYEFNERHALSLFGGYKWSKTNLDILVLTLNNKPLTPPKSDTKTSFKTTGPFVGVGYSWRPLSIEGKFSVNIAYGWLTGDYQFFVNGSPLKSDTRPSEGLRFGLSWNGPITRLGRGKLTYTISGDYYHYSMELPPDRANTKLTNLEETVGPSVGASLNYVWDF